MAKCESRTKKRSGNEKEIVQKSNIPRNIVQCYSLRFNKAATFLDRKKASKRGQSRHRQKFETDGGSACVFS